MCAGEKTGKRMSVIDKKGFGVRRTGTSFSRDFCGRDAECAPNGVAKSPG